MVSLIKTKAVAMNPIKIKVDKRADPRSISDI